jgi:soluble calcium-activated nucleotidase 1
MNDWMKVVRAPTRYRVGGNRLGFKTNTRYLLMALAALFFILIFYFILSSNSSIHRKSSAPLNSKFISKYLYDIFNDGLAKDYNSLYPLTPPVQNHGTKLYRLLAVADLDTSSKHDSSKFVSYLLHGKLLLNDNLKEAQIDFETSPRELSTQYAYGDRGMELSELVVFNGKLYSCDDRTGIVYEIRVEDRMAVPWVILVDGDGRNTSKGFKCEWMTVKDRKMYIGGLGKEWTTAKGELVNHNPQWIKVVGHLGDVSHVDWRDNYNKMRSHGGYLFPGYMIFESSAWSEADKKWYFLPRRASKDSYDETLDERRATNLMIKADEQFSQVDYQTIGTIIPVRGYSSFKFVPNTNERLIVALKSEEDAGSTRTYVTLFDVNGLILVADKLISDKFKYEGIEFV